MKTKIIMAALLALGLSNLTAIAHPVQIRVACPNDKTAAGIVVCIQDVECAPTDSLGLTPVIWVPNAGNYTVVVLESSLPPGATVTPLSQTITLNDNEPTLMVDFTLGGDFCGTPPPPGDCWLTGGGTIGKVKGVANYSFGGVVYPGCSPKAAEGGNWNVIDHFTGLHFQGQHIIVDSCSGVATRSPKVDVNIIDFHGFGIVSGIGGNPQEKVAVTFVGRAVDTQEPGGGKDMLYLSVPGFIQIGTSADDPAVISTGNLQIHTTSCD